MPLHISEIGVRLVVGAPGSAPPQTGPHSPEAGSGAALPPERFEELVRACTREVLEALRRLEER